MFDLYIYNNRKDKKMAKQPVYWAGSTPTKCNICESSFRGTMIDGRTRMGPWANMCSPCHKRHGVGLGTGRGQKYVQQPDGKWLKVEG